MKFILVVDDNADNRYHLEILLSSAGYRVSLASNGEEGLRKAKLEQPDLVISDVLMPVMDGFAFCRALRRDPTLQALPFVMYTATYTDDKDRELARSVGADAYLLRPEDTDRLVSVVADLLSTQSESNPGLRMDAEMESVILRQHNEALIRSLEKKMTELQAVNDELMRDRAVLKLQASALEAAADGIVITDPEGTIEWVNQAFVQLTEYAREEAIGRNPRDLVRSGVHDREHYKRLWDTILAGHVWRGELTNRTKSGRLYREFQTITPVRDEAGRIAHFVGIKTDTTFRHNIEERLREQAELLNIASDAIYVRTPEGVIRYWNSAAQRIYGITEKEAIGKRLEDLLPDVKGTSISKATDVVLGSGSWSGELKVRVGGAERVTYCRWGLLRDEDQEPREILAIDSDVTEWRRLEAQLRRAQRLEAIGTLGGGVAHDLNNSLAPITLLVEVLRRRHPEEGEILDSIVESVRRGAHLVRQLLGFARGSEGERKGIQVRGALRELEHMIRASFPKNIEIQTAYPGASVAVHADPTQLHQVLMNLCVNARDAMPNGGLMTLSVRMEESDESLTTQLSPRPGMFVVFEVQDTGCGVPEENLERIFDPFFTTKPPDRGTGLGLATVLGIVKGHGGFIKVDSKVGVGSKFSVYLPADEPSDGPETGRTSGQDFVGRRELVLVVDDEPAIREALRGCLQRFNLRVVTAVNGVDGLSKVREHQNQLRCVVADVHMPSKEGLTMIGELRALLPKVPVVAISGRFDDSVVGGLRALGVQAFIEKPFTDDQIGRELRRALGYGS